MKILSTAQIREADAQTISNEPIDSIDLMERASLAFVDWFIGRFDTSDLILVVCGTGNNGGDGLAISRILNSRGYQVAVVVVGDLDKGSDDFLTNIKRLESIGLVPETYSSKFRFKGDVLIDAIFGSGLSREVTGFFAEAMDSINDFIGKVVSVDIPSGLFADKHTPGEAVVRADHVVSFQVPKLAFLLPENNASVADWNVVDIDLDAGYLRNVETSYQTIGSGLVKGIYKPRPKFFHKGTAGRALLITGSLGKVGASVLCARACLRAGIGLLTVQIPKKANNILQVAVPEAMVILDENDDVISGSISTESFDVIGIGPGLGTGDKTYKTVRDYLEHFGSPVVIDADGLNMISNHPELIQVIPENSILTPHPGEFRRLVGEWENDYQRLEMQKEYSSKNKVIIVLKNAHTSISLPDGRVFFNTTGNPGMATAGSGDVLTGIITGFLGQGYTPEETAIISVYLHGLSGDLAAKNLSEESLIASDLIEWLPQAFGRVVES